MPALGLVQALPFRFGTGSIGLPSKGDVIFNGISYPSVLNDYDVNDRIGTLAPAEYTNVNCLAFDGTQIVECGVIDITSWTTCFMECYFEADPTQAITAFAMSVRHTGGDDLGIYFSASGNPKVRVDDGTGYDLTIDSADYRGVLVKITLWFDGTTLYGYINKGESNEVMASMPASFDFTTATGLLALGARNGGASAITGKLALCKFGETEGNLVVDIPCVDNPPSNVSGNGNNATSSTATLTQTSGIPPYNLTYGHTPSVVSEGSDEEYVDLGVKIDGDTKVRIVVSPAPIAEQNNASKLFGGISGSYKWVGYSSVGGGGSGGWYAGIGGATLDTDCGDYFEESPNEVIWDAPNDLLTINDEETVMVGPYDEGTFTLHLMREDDESQTNRGFIGEYQEAQIWKNGVLVFDLAPINDGQFYDKVSGTILSNDGTGTLTTKYSPALTEKTVSVATFDGVADFVEFTTPLTASRNKVSIKAEVVLPTFDSNLYAVSLNSGIYLGDPGISSGFSDFAGYPEARMRCETALGGFVELTAIVFNVDLFDDNFHEVEFLLYTDTGIMECYIDGNLEATESTEEELSPTAAIAELSTYANVLELMQMKSFSVEFDDVNVLDYRPYLVEGKTDSTWLDYSGNANTGLITVGTGGFDTFWGTRVADSRGIIVDAEHYLPIRRLGGLRHNGCEVSTTMTDPAIISMIYISGTGVSGLDGEALFGAYQNSRGVYESGNALVSWAAGTWTLQAGSTGETWTIVSDAFNIPKTGWSVGSLGSPAPVFEYGDAGSFWVDDSGNFLDNFYDDLMLLINGYQNYWMQFQPLGPDEFCHLREDAQYKLEKGYNIPEYNRLTNWASRYSDCGPDIISALLDEGGGYLLHPDETVVFTLD